MKAIVFTSETGHTAEYARLLSEKLGIPAVNLKDAKRSIEANSKIIYMGWLMAGNVKGYKEAARSFQVQCVCGVGMSGDESQKDDIRRTNKLPDDLPVFYLQGGLEMEKLHGIYRFMMKCVGNASAKKLQEKSNITPAEREALELFAHGKSKVCAERLDSLIEWYNTL